MIKHTGTSNQKVTNDRILIVVLFFLALTGIGLGIYVISSRPKTGFVDITKLYNSFHYKKELEAEYKNIEAQRKNILDSMKLSFSQYVRQKQSNNNRSASAFKEIQAMQEQYKLKEQQFVHDNSVLSEKYTQQILNQLNQYVQDYGRAYGYDYIFGASSNGTLMYAKDAENITEKVLKFVNNKYEGKGGGK